MGRWEFTGDLLRRTLPPPKVLSALFMIPPPLHSSPLFALFLSFYPSVPPSPTVSVPPSGIMSLDLKVWFNVYCIVTLHMI